ncbi:MAG: 30S ribosomal protein S18 [Deltaproteobacteria bacterium]|nr:MAG: 30S ribosomal protein S18 [Deltaproteobacteria bacterium]
MARPNNANVDAVLRARRRRRKNCPFCADKTIIIDYKDPKLLRRFITERGKIVPRRVSGVCARHQRRLALAIKRSRHIAFLPFLATE